VLAVTVALVPLLAYPMLTVARGSPDFPSRDECAQLPGSDANEDLEVVYGHRDDPDAANELLASVTAVGFVGANVEQDGCGGWKVSYDGIESAEQGEALVREVREAGFEARVEAEG
jgi:hypothetical protein